MAKDMVCKLCEADTTQEVAILLVSDLTGSGQLPIPIGPRCLPAWLTEMLEMFALAAPPEAEAELSEDDEAMLEAYEASLVAAESPEESAALNGAGEPDPGPTSITGSTGRSQRDTSKPAAGNGSGRVSKPKRTPTKSAH